MTLLKEILQINESRKSKVAEQINKWASELLPEWKRDGSGTSYIAMSFLDDEEDEWEDNIDDLMSHFEHNYSYFPDDEDQEKAQDAIYELEGLIRGLIDENV